MKKVALLSFVVLFVFSEVFSSYTTNPVNNSGSLSEILNEDGTINMELAENGAYSALGYELISEDDEEPVFQPKSGGSNEGWTGP